MAANRRGAVENVLSGAALRGTAVAGLYRSTKAALMLLTQAWAAEFGPTGVRVNAVAAGTTITEGTAAQRAGLEHIASNFPPRRLGEPAEAAAAVAFLASDDASYVHGVVLPVDGGALAAI